MRGRRIIVTGASAGIGKAIAAMLVEAGAQVVVSDIDPEKIEATRAEIGAALAVGGDISDEMAVAAMFADAVAKLGGLDGLVNNAGVPDPPGGTRRQTLTEWRKVIDVNLQGVFLASREATRAFNDGGAIVNIASIAGLCAFPASNAYSVSKAGVVMMTKTLALDLARFGVRVNAIAPGMVDAPMAQAMLADDAVRSRIMHRIPAGRLGRADEIARAARFLLSADASYITGVVLPVDGGWSASGAPGEAI